MEAMPEAETSFDIDVKLSINEKNSKSGVVFYAWDDTKQRTQSLHK